MVFYAKQNEVTMSYVEDVYDDNYDQTYSYWTERAADGVVEDVLKELKGDLTTLYVRMDNDHEGRGAMGDAGISGQIAGLETVRVEIEEKLKK